MPPIVYIPIWRLNATTNESAIKNINCVLTKCMNEVSKDLEKLLTIRHLFEKLLVVTLETGSARVRVLFGTLQ